MTDQRRNIIRRPGESDPWFRQEDLADPVFYAANREAIHDALNHGRIIQSEKSIASYADRDRAAKALKERNLG